MTGPGEALDARRQQGVDAQVLVHLALHQPAAAGVQQHVQRVGLVAEGGGKAPDDQLRHPLAQARQRQLQLHAALVAQELVPFVHHQHAQTGEGLARIGAGQQQGQAFRRGDQRAGQTPSLPRTLGTAGIAGAQADAPADAEVVQRRLQGAGGVGGQGAHRGDPEHRQRRRLVRRGGRGCLGRKAIQGAEPDGVGFA